MQKAGWVETIVGELRAAKLRGAPFEDAWTRAVRLYPPKGRDAGRSDGALFDPDQDGETVVQFTYRVCRQAWFGERPALAGFTMDAMMGLVSRDWSRDAMSPGRIRRAA